MWIMDHRVYIRKSLSLERVRNVERVYIGNYRCGKTIAGISEAASSSPSSRGLLAVCLSFVCDGDPSPRALPDVEMI